jgi:hypothetical protein
MRGNSRRRTLKAPLIITTPSTLPFSSVANRNIYGMQMQAIGGHGTLTWELDPDHPQGNGDLTITPDGRITYNPNGPMTVRADAGHVGEIEYNNPTPPGEYVFYIKVSDEY